MKIHREGLPTEIALKEFYSLSNKERREHINALKELDFKQLSQTDLGIVYFWFQNWLLDSWPIPKQNFISIQDKTDVIQN